MFTAWLLHSLSLGPARNASLARLLALPMTRLLHAKKPGLTVFPLKQLMQRNADIF
jgi:hypothetical protein